LLAYLIAINSHGPTRLGLSYFIATLILAGTVWAIVQYVNTQTAAEEYKKLELEKRNAEDHIRSQEDSLRMGAERVKSQEEILRQSKERVAIAGRINSASARSAALASTMLAIELQDRSADLDVLIGRANDMVKKVGDIKKDFDSQKPSDSTFSEAVTLCKDGLQMLVEAAYYYKSFYYSEDSDQEVLRQNIMRQKARTANDKFQRIATLLSSIN
jgi:hypothetical protein